MADPWEPPPLPSLQYRVTRNPDVTHIGGPDRIVDNGKEDPEWKPRPIGFLADFTEEENIGV